MVVAAYVVTLAVAGAKAHHFCGFTARLKSGPDTKHQSAEWSDCLFCQACEGWSGCGKGVDGVHLGNAAAFPTFPQRCGGWGFLRKQNSSRWRLSELLQHVPSFGIESHQEFMSQGDANHFLGFAGRR